jgi:hypothetical protein
MLRKARYRRHGVDTGRDARTRRRRQPRNRATTVICSAKHLSTLPRPSQGGACVCQPVRRQSTLATPRGPNARVERRANDRTQSTAFKRTPTTLPRVRSNAGLGAGLATRRVDGTTACRTRAEADDTTERGASLNEKRTRRPETAASPVHERIALLNARLGSTRRQTGACRPPVPRRVPDDVG